MLTESIPDKSDRNTVLTGDLSIDMGVVQTKLNVGGVLLENYFLFLLGGINKTLLYGRSY